MLGQLTVGVGPSSPTGYGGLLAAPPWMCSALGRRRWRRRRGVFWVSAAVNSHRKNHYTILGVPRSASSSDIKKAYRLLARKWHPDVSKDSQAGEVFKNIHLAYEVLSNEATRVEYDRVLKSHEYATDPIRRNIYNDSEFEDEIRIRRWHEVRQKMRRDGYQRRYDDGGGENFSYYSQSDEESEDETSVEEDQDRGPFIEVLGSVFLSLFLMRTVGSQLSLMFSSMMAFGDGKLDGGYKLGYLIAWIMGGRGGVLLSMCLSFASWACGKRSSSVVALVVVAMWVGSNILSYAPLPQGALLALLYMSVKLQVDLN